jgi:hypothetical protein
LAIIGSSVVAALVTSVFSLVSARSAGHRLAALEQAKQEDARNTFRYTKLYEALAELRALPPINYRFHEVGESGDLVESRDRFGRVVEETTTRYGIVNAIYGRVQPLIEPNLRAGADQLFTQEREISSQFAEYAIGGQELPPGVDIVTLLDLRRGIEEAVLRAVREQFERLTATAEIAPATKPR